MEKIFVSNDGLAKPSDVYEMNTPEPYNAFGVPIMDFHPDEPDWYTFISGGRDCGLKTCHSSAYITKNGGKNFTLIDTWVTKCNWVSDVNFSVKEFDKDAVYCASYKLKDGRIGQDKLSPSKEHPARLTMIAKSGKLLVPLLDANVLDFYVVDDILLVAGVVLLLT